MLQQVDSVMRVLDQAAGLRRMLQPRVVRVLPVLDSGRDYWLAALLAEALARQGERVLLIDQGDGAAAGALGIRPRHTLAEVISGRCELDEAIGVGSQAVQAALAGELFALLRAQSISAEAFFGAFAHIPAPLDLVLLRVTQPAVIAQCLVDEAEILLSTSAAAPALFNAYSNLKRTCARAHRYRMVVHGIAGAAEAFAVHERVARTAERFLGIAPQFAAHFPVAPGERGGSRHAIAAHAAEQLAAQVVSWPLAQFPSHERAPVATPTTH